METSDFIPMQKGAHVQGKSFLHKAEENPCTGCSAPCCRVLLIPHPTPSTFMDLDYIRYMIGFPKLEMILNSDGQWQVLIEQTCRLLDEETNLCTVHATARKPKTCVFFNPYPCWYRWSFHKKENPPNLIRINMEAFEEVLAHVQFDEDGKILQIPTWEFIRNLVNNKSDRTNKPSLQIIERTQDGKDEKVTNTPMHAEKHSSSK
jgi:hypothetical protein